MVFMNTEKRIFGVKKDLNDNDKNMIRNKFVNQLRDAIKGKIDRNDLIEIDDGNKWSLMFCDGARIYTLCRFKNKVEIENRYSAEERKVLRNFFRQFVSVLFKREVQESEIGEDESDTSYKMMLYEDGSEKFSLEYKKKSFE